MTSPLNQQLGAEPKTMGNIKEEAAVEEDAPDPAPKKSRTNTPWTAAEENRLRALKNENKGWGEIAKAWSRVMDGADKSVNNGAVFPQPHRGKCEETLV